MNRLVLLGLPLLMGAVTDGAWKYPATRTVNVSDTYFGKTYADPYRWLEDLKAADTQSWFKEQAELTDGVLEKIPGRDALVREWMALDRLRPADYSGFSFEGGRLFYKKTLGGENVGKLYYRKGWSGPEALLFDPGTYQSSRLASGVTTIQSFRPSWDGKFVVLGLSAGGAEYSEIKVLEVEKGMLPESMYPSYGALGWLPDSRSFFYDAGKATDLKSLEIEQHRKTRVHRLGTDPSRDVDVFSDEKDPELGIEAKDFPEAMIDESSPGLLIGALSTVQSEQRAYVARVADLRAPKIQWTSLCQRSDKLVRGLEIQDDHAYAVTATGAPRYKLVRTTVNHPDWASAQTVLPEAADTILRLTRSKDFLFVVYSNGVTGRIVKVDLKTQRSSEVKLPASGSVNINCPDRRGNHCLLSATSWIVPYTLYDYDAEKDTVAKSLFNSDVTYPGFDQLETEEVEVPGHDGTMIPLSIIHQRGMALDGSHSCILTGYGAYGSSARPWFNIRNSVALHGVVMAIAHPRGGSEKGEAWYRAGFKTTKPNTWKDFISCAEYLVKKGYTSPAKLGGTGTSAGGILISRAITERPDLFGAAVCNVGCANAMRMEFSPNGPVNTPEFGTVKDPVEAQALYEMDGVQHVQKGVKYPALLGVGGWNDPRVAPWEPGKFVAAVQAASTSGKPVLMKVNYDNGHFTEEKSVTFKNFAAQTAFLLWQTGHPEFQPTAH